MCSCTLVGGAGSCLCGAQGHTQEDFKQPVCWWVGCVPVLLVVWPEVTQHWSLQAVGWGHILWRKWWPPGGLMSTSPPQNYHHQCPCPHSEPQPPPASAGDPPILSPARSLMRSLLFSLGLGTHRTLCTPSKSRVSFPPILWNYCDQTQLAFKTRFSGGSSSHC